MDNLQDEILELIELKYEGTYWDFKRQWPDKQDLLHDIICMANNLHKGQSYLIIGIDESKDYEIVGVSEDERKNQQNLIDFLKDKPFAGGVRPEVQVRTLVFDNKEIDIIIIMPSDKVPFYLEKKQQLNVKKKQQKELFSYTIYSRIQDTNTPVDKSADIDIVEKLWRRRFGIDRPVMERLAIALDDYKNWEFNSDDLPIYNKLSPDFHIKYGDEPTPFNEYCADFYCNTDAHWATLKIYYHSTIVYSSSIWYLDDMRVCLPEATYTSIHDEQSNEQLKFYYYYEKSSIPGKLAKLFGKVKGKYFFGSGRAELPPMLLFEDKEDRLNFEEYVKNNMSEYKSIKLDGIAENIIESTERKHENIEVYISICKMIKMYERRKAIVNINKIISTKYFINKLKLD